MPEKRYHVMTFGCRVNQADTAAIVADLDRHAFVRASSSIGADVIILNTCTVTHRSDADVRKAVHRVRRENPQARIVVAGCFAQRDPKVLTELGPVDAVVGQTHQRRLPIIVDDLLTSRATDRGVIVAHEVMSEVAREDLPPVEACAVGFERTRPFVKVQDGCSAACTYCIIPSVRGPGRSAPVLDVLDAVGELIEQGHFEIVLTGVHLGRYGEHFEPRVSLTDLVTKILDLPGLGRLRLSGIEPMAFSMSLADLAASDTKLAPHFHLPVQSGSDRVLKRMARPYRAKDVEDILRQIRARVPHVCLGTDLIVGFPGEDDEDLAATERLVEDAGVDYLHVFSYSDRPGTPASRLAQKVDPRIVKARSHRLLAVGERLFTAFLDRQVGRTLRAVTLGREGEKESLGALSENYAPIEADSDSLTANRRASFHILARRGRALLGKRVIGDTVPLRHSSG